MDRAVYFASMATCSPYNKEKANYIRLCNLLVDIGRQVFQDVFDNIHRPSPLNIFLSSNKTTLTILRTNNILYRKQWDTLFPATGAVTSDDFDITLLFLLLRNICNLKAPGTGWTKPPSVSDLSKEADLVRIKWYRNELYAHISNTAIPDNEFQTLWGDIKAALLRLGGSKYQVQIQSFMEKTLDPESENSFKALMQAWEEKEESVDKAMISIKGTVKVFTAAGLSFSWAAGSAYIIHRYRNDPETLIRLVQRAILPSFIPVTAAFVYALVPGSFKILVEVRSLDALDEIWKSYIKGDMKKKLEKVIVTDEMRNLAPDDAVNVDISLVISKDEYKKARDYLIQSIEERKLLKGDGSDNLKEKIQNYDSNAQEFSSGQHDTASWIPESVKESTVNTEFSTGQHDTASLIPDSEKESTVFTVFPEFSSGQHDTASLIPDSEKESTVLTVFPEFSSGQHDTALLIPDSEKESTVNTGSPIKNLQHLHDNLPAIEAFSKCLDPKLKNNQNWEDLAHLLGVPPDTIRTCGLYFEHSPTIRLCQYLEKTRPAMSIDDLRKGLTRNQKRTRHDIMRMIDAQGFSGKDKVSVVVTNSASPLLDQIALKLDSATRPTCGWYELGLELNIKRDQLRQFKMYVNYNPTENLFRCLYSTSKESIKASVIVDFLTQMKREDILVEVEALSQSEDITTKEAKDVFKLGSELLDKTAKLLNLDTAGVDGWRRLAQLLVEKHYIDIPDIVSSLEPPHQHEFHSPTKKTIEWLVANKPEVTIADLIKKTEEMQRNDAVQILIEHFYTSRATEFSSGQHDTASLIPDSVQEPTVSTELSSGQHDTASLIPDSVQEPTVNTEFSSGQHDTASLIPDSVQEPTVNTGHIRDGKTRSFGLPESTDEIVGRQEEIENLVSIVTSETHRLVLLHGPPGSGKSTMAIATASELLKSDKGYTCIRVTSEGVLGVECLASKILTACGIPPPYVEEEENVKRLFKNIGRKCVLFLDNFDQMFHASDGLNASTTISSTKSTVTKQTKGDEVSSKAKYLKFLEDLLISANLNLTIFATTWESLSSTRVNTKQVELPRLSQQDSEQLLVSKCKTGLGIDSSSIPRDIFARVIDCCSGNPQLLLNAVVVFNDMGPTAGAAYITSSPPDKLLRVLCPDTLANRKNRFNDCLRICFDFLDKYSQTVLIMISVFPGSFSLGEVQAVFKEIMPDQCAKFELAESLLQLKKFSFLSYNQHQGSYFLAPAMRSFALKVATLRQCSSEEGIEHTAEPQSLERDWNCTYKSAISRFVYYTFDITYKIEQDFFSTHSKDAIEKYRKQEKNLEEIAYWCISDRLSSDPDLERIKHHAIQSFVECSLVNIMLMKTRPLTNIFGKFSQICKDYSTNTKYIECLIYGAVACILDCQCLPNFCVFAQRQTMGFFDEAIKTVSDTCRSHTFLHSSPALSKQLVIVSKSKVMSKTAQTQLLIKYGKYLVRLGRKKDGLKFINTGIEIRKNAYKKSKSVKDRVMVAAGYNDLACAHSYMGDSHGTAISIRQDKVLPVFQRDLGMHPFTASALSHLAHDLLALNQYDEALIKCKKALSYRVSLLGSHFSTARSYFEMGVILREKACQCKDPADKKEKYEEALKNFTHSLEMRQLLVNTSKELALTHLEIADVLMRLGRYEEAQEHDGKILKHMQDFQSQHVNYSCSH